MSKFRGVWTALITPFRKGEVDYQSLGKLISFQLENKIEGFVVSGTTAESPTLSFDERKAIFQFVTSEVAGQVPIMFGSGSNSTRETIELSKAAQGWGAQSLLVVVPYYNKPPQKGLELHFKAVAQSVDIPVMLYNVPGRTITSLEVKTIQSLTKVKNIFGIKEATGNIEFGQELMTSCPGFTVFSGDDGTCVELATKGSQGVISVISHVIPSDLVRIHKSARDKNKNAVNEFSRFNKVTDLIFKEANPIPVKYALKKLGLIESAELRLPLIEVSESLAQSLDVELQQLGLIS